MEDEAFLKNNAIDEELKCRAKMHSETNTEASSPIEPLNQVGNGSNCSSLTSGKSASIPPYIRIEMQMAYDRLQGSCTMFQYQHGGLPMDEGLPNSVVHFLTEATAPNPFLNPPKTYSSSDQQRLRQLGTISQGALGITSNIECPRIPHLTKPFRSDNQSRKIAANSSSMSQRYEQRCSALVFQWCRQYQQQNRGGKSCESEKFTNVLLPKSVVRDELSSVVVVHFLNVPIEYKLLTDLFVDFGSLEISAVNAPPNSVKVTFAGTDAVLKLLNECGYNNNYGYIHTFPRSRRNISVRLLFYWKSLSVYQRYEWFRESQIFEPVCHVRGIASAITAEQLAAPFEYLFGPVLFAKIFLDDNGYPTDWGYVVFRERSHYKAALRTGLITVKSQNLQLSLEAVPSFEKEPCTYCFAREGVIFCRHTHCFTFYCNSCFVKVHDMSSLMQQIDDPLISASDEETHRVYVCKNENEMDRDER